MHAVFFLGVLCRPLRVLSSKLGLPPHLTSGCTRSVCPSEVATVCRRLDTRIGEVGGHPFKSEGLLMHAQCVKGAAPLVFGLRVCGPFFFSSLAFGPRVCGPLFLAFRARAGGLLARASSVGWLFGRPASLAVALGREPTLFLTLFEMRCCNEVL